MRLLAIFGTRPELIKLAPVVRALRATSDGLDLRICATAQHRDLVDPLLRLFDITPDIDLDVMRPDQSPSDVIRDVIGGLAPIIGRDRPDWVMVQGDTSSTLAAAIAARYAGVPIVHIEAGLRTGRLDQPFPEEANRRLVGAIADLHCAPTARAREHLLNERVPDAQIVVTGNTGIDALKWALTQSVPADVDRILDGAGRDIVLMTVHRRESFGEPLEQICLALRDLSERYGPAVRFVWPVHPNPHVRTVVQRIAGDRDGIVLTPPMDYLTMVHLLKRSRLVLTDSGGLQEEAPSLGKPVLVMREITERPEGIDAGAARLVGANRHRIVSETSRLIEDDVAYVSMARPVDLYGDGHASARIAGALQRVWKSTEASAGKAVLLLCVMLFLGACGRTSPPAQSQAPASVPPSTAPATQPPPPATTEKPAADVESKIDSQLLVEIHRLEGTPTPPGSTGVRHDDQQRALVDVRAEVTPDVIALVAAAGPIVSSSSRDRSVMAWLPVTSLMKIAASPSVRGIVPAAAAITQTPPKIDEAFDLRVGGALTIGDMPLTVSVERVADDSRCPVNVTCVWAGDATVHVNLAAPDGKRAAVDVHTMSGKQEERAMGYRVRLIKLLPQRPAEGAIAQDQYVATLLVSRDR